jgi:hypothetical protein
LVLSKKSLSPPEPGKHCKSGQPIPVHLYLATPLRGGQRGCGFPGRPGLTRIIHDGSSRNRGVAKRDGQAQPGGTETYLKQYGPLQAARYSGPYPPCRLEP